MCGETSAIQDLRYVEIFPDPLCKLVNKYSFANLTGSTLYAED